MKKYIRYDVNGNIVSIITSNDPNLIIDKNEHIEINENIFDEVTKDSYKYKVNKRFGKLEKHNEIQPQPQKKNNYRDNLEKRISDLEARVEKLLKKQ